MTTLEKKKKPNYLEASAKDRVVDEIMEYIYIVALCNVKWPLIRAEFLCNSDGIASDNHINSKKFLGNNVTTTRSKRQRNDSSFMVRHALFYHLYSPKIICPAQLSQPGLTDTKL